MRKSLKQKAMVAVPIATLGLLYAGSARADVALFSADFETSSGYTSGLMPADNPSTFLDTSATDDPTTQQGHYLPVPSNSVTGQPTAGLQWIGGGYDSDPTVRPLAPDPWGNPAFVVANPNTSASPASGVANTSANVLAFIGSATDNTIHPSLAAVDTTLNNSTQPVTVNLQLYFPSTTSNAGNAREVIVSYLGLNLNFGNYGPDYGDTKLSFTSPDAKITDVTADVWHQLTMVIDPVAGSVSFAIDGGTPEQISAAALAVNNPYYLGVDSVNLADTKFNVSTDSTNHDTDGIYLDNLSITQAVPEPASLGLLGFGGLLLMRRRSK